RSADHGGAQPDAVLDLDGPRFEGDQVLGLGQVGQLVDPGGEQRWTIGGLHGDGPLDVFAAGAVVIQQLTQRRERLREHGGLVGRFDAQLQLRGVLDPGVHWPSVSRALPVRRLATAASPTLRRAAQTRIEMVPTVPAVGERGQGTVEWVALLLVVLVALAAGAAVGLAGPAAGMARAVRCAVLAGCHGEDSELATAYGSDVAGMVRAFAPGFDYEPRTLTLPVDFRSCRAHRCADAPDLRGADVWRSTRGRQATVFTHAVDRRSAGGDLFVQYWLYYPDSTWNGALYAASRLPILGHIPAGLLAGAVSGHHGDDWESYQVRVTRSGEVLARSSAHNGYAGRHHWPNLNELPIEVPVPALDRDL